MGFYGLENKYTHDSNHTLSTYKCWIRCRIWEKWPDFRFDRAEISLYVCSWRNNLASLQSSGVPYSPAPATPHEPPNQFSTRLAY